MAVNYFFAFLNILVRQVAHLGTDYSILDVLWNTGYKTMRKESETDIPSGSYPHCNHKAINFMTVRISMQKNQQKKLFYFFLLPTAKLDCYAFVLRFPRMYSLFSVETSKEYCP